MSQQITNSDKEPIILTTGVYDLVKEHLRKKKVSPAEEEILRQQLKTAMQVPRKELPANVVNVDTKVSIRDHKLGQDKTYVFVAPDKAKKRNHTESILSPLGLAIVGCKEGDSIRWTIEGEERQIDILNVERLA